MSEAQRLLIDRTHIVDKNRRRIRTTKSFFMSYDHLTEFLVGSRDILIKRTETRYFFRKEVNI